MKMLRRYRGEIGLFFLCLFLFFWRLGNVRLFDLDEGLYVSCARQMVLSGDLITPRLNSRPQVHPEQTTVPFFEKPIMVYWLSAGALRLLGMSEGAARVPVACASLLTTFLVVWVGSRWFGRRAGLLAGLVYATVPMTLVDARQMTTDAPLMLCFLLMMLALRERRVLLFWVAAGLAVLTKGAIGLVLPGLVLGVYGILRMFSLATAAGGASPVGIRIHRTGWRPRVPLLRVLMGLLLFLAIVLPWHLAIYRAGGRDAEGRTWVQEYLIRQHVGRFKGQDTVHNAPLPTYIGYFLIGFFPWACFTPFAFRGMPSQAGPRSEAPGNSRAEGDPPMASPSEEHSRQGLRVGNQGIAGAAETRDAGTATPATPGSAEERRREAHRYLLCWFWSIFVFFSLSAAKLPTYIVPTYPAAALLVGAWLDRRWGAPLQTGQSKGLATGSFAALMTALLLLVTALVLPIVTRARPVMPDAAAALTLLLTLVTTLGCLAAWLCFRRGDRAPGWRTGGIAALAATMALLVLLITGPGYAVANHWIFGPYQDLAMLARKDAAMGVPVIYYNFRDRRASMLYYAWDYSPIERKEMPLLPYLEQSHILPKSGEADVIAPRTTYEKEFKAELEAAHWTVEQITWPHKDMTSWLLLRIRRPGAAQNNRRVY